MAFKDNLLKKIEIKKLSRQVMDSMGPPDSGRRIDKPAAQQLLEMGGYSLKKVRDLDLYLTESTSGTETVIVLDNDLPYYRTSIEDVAMRKSPTVKEMINIKNIIRILNDADVVVSKQVDTVEFVREKCIDRLDLTFSETDLADIQRDGAASLDGAYAEGVIESLELFAEILQYIPPPKPFRISHTRIFGFLAKEPDRQLLFGPVVIYSLIHNTLKFIESSTGVSDSETIKKFHMIADGKADADREGATVFEYLKNASMRPDRQTI
jgi:hypothetical protein